MPWSVKYKPKNLKEFVNQFKALETFLKWIKNWKPGSKALLFHGPPGVGKTALMEAFSGEKKLEFIEMNASDARSASQIEKVLGQSTLQRPLFKKTKIFLIDEIDGLAGRADMGGPKTIIKILKETRYPIVLVANNPWDPKLRSIRNYCILVQFTKISVWDIEKRLSQICENEKIKADKEVLRQLAKSAKGDLRSAINDLEIVSQGRKRIEPKDLDVLSYREKEVSIFDVLKAIFKTKNALAAKLSINNVDKDPDEIFWWIENNIAREYEDPEEIAKAYGALSKADIFKKRISSRQNWRFKAYMIDMMTAGVALAKKEMYRKFTRYQYPSKIIVLGITKRQRKEEREMLQKLSKQLHCSERKVRKEFLPFFKIMIRDKVMRNQIESSFNLTKDDTSILR